MDLIARCFLFVRTRNSVLSATPDRSPISKVKEKQTLFLSPQFLPSLVEVCYQNEIYKMTSTCQDKVVCHFSYRYKSNIYVNIKASQFQS